MLARLHSLFTRAADSLWALPLAISVVCAVLAIVALRDTDKMRQDMMRMEAIINEHREHERTLKTTLITAQKLADDIKAHAETEAARIVRDAESRSVLMLEKAQARLEDIQRAIDGLKLKRKDVETTIEATIQGLRNAVEFVRDLEAHDREERVLLHRPRHVDSSASRHAAAGND